MANARMVRAALCWGTIGIVSAMVPSEALAAATVPVSFELRTVKDAYLVGEPVVVVLTQRGSAQMYNEGFGTLWRQDTRFRLLVNRGQGFTRFRRKRIASGWEEPNLKVLMKDGELAEYVLSYDENIGDWMFPSPGTAQLAVEYEDESLGLIRSNVVMLAIKAPSGDEKDVYEALRNSPNGGAAFLLDLNEVSPSLAGESERRLIERYPKSVYLQGARARSVASRVAHVSDQLDPTDPMSPPVADRETREQLLRERRAQFVADAEALVADLEGGQFAPDAVMTLAAVYAAAGDQNLADQLYGRVARDFPDRAAGREALEEVGDTQAPDLHVRVLPSSLWPPNHKLVPVTIEVTVSDDTDPSPAVKLVSITCNDACDPTEDIAGLTLNTDDRDFELRAERTGGGSGRTYTITYSATDASGNSTTAKATVVVPHDQR